MLAQPVAVQHAPDGCGHITTTHVEAIPWNAPPHDTQSVWLNPAVQLPSLRQHAPMGHAPPVPHATPSPM